MEVLTTGLLAHPYLQGYNNPEDAHTQDETQLDVLIWPSCWARVKKSKKWN